MNEITLTRLGDFWEAFDADAELLAKVCRLALSTVASGRKLAGFPIQRLEEYRSRLADANVHVLLKEGRNE